MATILKPPGLVVPTPGFYGKFLTEMRKYFIKIDPFANPLSLGLVGGKNSIFWGPGGYGKSEGMEVALRLVEEKPGEAFVLSCDESMTPERLFGGIDLRAMSDPANPRIEYAVDRSFLQGRYAVLEEGLDMPEQTITSLKDTLTAKMLRNGPQRAALQCENVFINTNLEPAEKATLGDTTKALLSRFPIQARVAWDSHGEDDYLAVGKAVAARPELPTPGLLAKELRKAQELYKVCELAGAETVLAHLFAEASSKADPISPRTYILAEQIVKAAAAMRGRKKVNTNDLLALEFVPGIAAMDNLLKSIREAAAKDEVDRLAESLFLRRKEINDKLNEFIENDNYAESDDLEKQLNAIDREISSAGMLDVVLELMKKDEAERARQAA
jgi:hypothetical protein